MGKIVIFRNGSAHIDLVERGKRTINDATLTRTMLSDDTVDLKVSSNSVLDIRVNDYFSLFGENYRINQVPEVDKINDSNYNYIIKAQGLMYDLLRCKFFNADGSGFKTTLDFPLIGTLELFLTVIKNNMSRFSDKWDFAPLAEAGETKTLTFGSDTCLSALQKICQEFKTDFWVKSEGGKFVIHTGAFGSTVPVTFEYGKGKGLYGLSRKNVNEEGVINRMYVEGGSENLPNNYRNFSNNLKFSDEGYLEDSALISQMGLKEGDLKLEEIYPHRTGKVTALGDTKFKFIDSTMDFDLNEKEADGITTKYLKPDTSAKIHFNTGNLAGYQFEIKKGGYKHATKEFEIIPITTTGDQKMPDSTTAAFQFGVNDEYVLLDIYAPEIYITNAENELLTKATEQFNLKKQIQVSYDLTVDPAFLKDLGTPINIGDYVRVKDGALNVDKVIRVNSIVRNFIQNREWKENVMKLVIADSYEISFSSQLILDVKEIVNVNNITGAGQINYSMIGLKTTRELQSLVFDTDGYFNGENIRPNSIETNMLSVGSQSQQLSCSVVFRVNADGLKNKIVSETGKVFSQTFNKTWDIPALTTTLPDDNYRYVYAKCSKTGSAGNIFYTQSQIKFDADPNEYYFLLGILHTVVEGMRVLSITVGTTTINGGLVRTGIISSLDGQTSFNLNTGEIKGKITFLPTSPAFTQVSGMISTEIANLRTEVGNEINDVSAAVNNLSGYIDGSFSDGIIDAAEAIAIEKYINQINTEKADVQNKYNQIYNDTYLTGTPKTNLSTAWNNYSVSHTNLINSITTAIADGATTPTEKADVDAKFLLYRNNLATLSTRFQESVKSIETATVNAVQIGGRNLIAISNLRNGYVSYPSGDYLGSAPTHLSFLNRISCDGKKSLVFNGIPDDLEFNVYFKNTNGDVVVSLQKGIPISIPIGSTSFNIQISSTEAKTPVFVKDRKIKLEFGTKATDWTPAPEDIDVAIAGANANAANALAQAQNAVNTAAAAAAVTSFMQTTIDGNVVSTGTLQVGDVNGANAMISGVTDKPNGESIRFAAGKSYAEKYLSPFQVLDNGMVRFVNPATGQKTFELGYNQNTGKVVFDIYNDDGVKVASIGSQGIMFTGYVPESYERQNMRKLTTTTFTQAAIASEMSMNIGRQLLSSNPSGNSYNVGIVTNIETYLYDPGRNFESAGNTQYAGYYPTKNKLGPTVSDGIYIQQGLQYAEDYGDINTYVEYYVTANQITNGKITNTIGFTISVRIKNMSFVTFGDGDFY